MTRVLKIGLCLLWCCSGIVFAQQSLNFVYDNIDLGPEYQNTITYGTCRDTSGYLWIATEKGLLKYDGYQTKVFTHDSTDPGSISSSDVASVYVDKFGTLWVGTKPEGLNKFEGGKFKHFFLLKDLPEGTGNTWVKDFVEDDEGNFWIAMDGAGLVKFDRETEEYILFTHDSTNQYSIPGNAVTSLLYTSDKQLFVGTYQGLCRLDNLERGSFTRFSFGTFLTSRRIMSLAEAKDGSLWAGTFDGGVCRINGDLQTCLPLDHFPYNYSVISMGKFLDGLILGSWSEGVVLYDYKKGDVIRNSKFENKKAGLQSGEIRNIFEDDYGVFWISTNKGIVKLDKFNRKFTQEMHTDLKKHPKDKIEVKGFLEHGEKKVFILTDSGLKLFEKGKGIVDAPIVQKMEAHIGDVMVNCMVKENNRIYIGTREKGLFVFSENGQLIRQIHGLAFSKDGKEYSSHVIAVLIDSGKAYILSNSLWEMDLKSYQLRLLHVLDNQHGTCLEKDKEGNIWFAAWQIGASKYDPKNDKIYINPGVENIGTVNCLFLDSQGNLWMGTRKGLSIFNQENNMFELLKMDDKFENIGVWDIQESNNKLWISTEYGVAMKPVMGDEFIIYNNSNGLPDVNYIYSSGLTTKQGELFFGTDEGFLHFYPDLLNQKESANRIEIEGVFSNCMEMLLPSSDEVYEIFKNKTFCIKTVFPDLSNPEKSKYFYRLGNTDTIWINNSYNRTIQFDSLPKGNHFIYIKAVSQDNVWSKNQALVKVHIVGRWLKYWWVIGIALLIILLVVFLIYKIKGRKLPKYAKSALKKEDMKKYLNQLQDFMEENKPYLKGEVYLKEIAESLNINQNYLSQTINELTKKNFFDFVNDYRIEEAKKLLVDPANNKMNLLGIGYESGFNSKTSFYTIFKKHTGQTPAEYRKKNQSKK